jgi:nucleoid-associated protein YgaU
MVQYFRFGLNAAVLLLILAIQTGCSSSPEGATDVTPETVAQAGAATEAGTNNVPLPAADPAAPGAMEASVVPPPVTDASAPIEPTTSPLAAAPESQSSVSTGVSGEFVQYKVRRGDTLMKIAFEKFGDLHRWKDILNTNQGVLAGNPELRAGMVLNIEGAIVVAIEHQGEIYLIKKGDTLGLISKDVYGTPKKWKRLWENNRTLIKNPNHIYAGFNLYYIPDAKLTDGEGSSPPSASSQPLPFKGQDQQPDMAKGSVPGPYRMPSSTK